MFYSAASNVSGLLGVCVTENLLQPAEGHQSVKGTHPYSGSSPTEGSMTASLGGPQLSSLFLEALGSSSGKYQCERCLKFFTRHSSVVRHQASCQTTSVIPCDLCDSSFSRLDSLQRHMKNKHDIDSSGQHWILWNFECCGKEVINNL